MAELKTRKNQQDPMQFLEQVENVQRRENALVVHKLMQKITGDPGSMWGPSIVGFGQYHLKYASGRELDWFLTGYSPRKASLTLYIMNGFSHYDEIRARLGKHKTGKSCLYINKLADIDMEVLEELISASVKYLKNKHSS